MLSPDMQRCRFGKPHDRIKVLKQTQKFKRPFVACERSFACERANSPHPFEKRENGTIIIPGENGSILDPELEKARTIAIIRCFPTLKALHGLETYTAVGRESRVMVAQNRFYRVDLN